jgi:hypothetical protein
MKMNFDFENWDFLDPKIVSKFKNISDVSQMLLNQQNQLKSADCMSFKDKQKVQSNINRFKKNLESLVSNQKDQFIDYFDNQVNARSKGVNVPQLSRTFIDSRRLYDSSSRSRVENCKKASHGRRYSEGDLSVYLKEQETKNKVLEELKSSKINKSTIGSTNQILSASILREREVGNEDTSRLYESKTSSRLHLGDLESHRDFRSRTNTTTAKGLKNRTRRDSIFSEGLEDNDDTQACSYFYEKKVRELQDELARVKQEVIPLRKFYNDHKKRTRTIKRKDFTKDRKKRVLRKDLSYKPESEVEPERTEHDIDEFMQFEEEIHNLKEQNENLRQGLREIGKLVIRNEDTIQEILRSKEEIEKECKLSKELNSVLLENFSNFKKYVEKTFGTISNRLATYVQKEEYYSEIVKENEQLKQKCKALLMKLKEMAEL